MPQQQQPAVAGGGKPWCPRDYQKGKPDTVLWMELMEAVEQNWSIKENQTKTKYTDWVCVYAVIL